jgi:hypothetical protein
VKKRFIAVSVLTAGALLAGCSGGLSTNGTSYSPPVSQTNLNNNKLEFAVGTATYNGGTYLNTVVSFRQPNGNSAVLVDTPTINGPTGFTVPTAGSAGTDANTSHISGTLQTAPTNPPASPPPATTFGQSGGAFSYGFAPLNAGTTGAALYPGNPSLYFQPFYLSTSSKYSFYGGPPAYPFFNDGTYPPGFQGYPLGFTMFGAAPVAGQYSLSVVVPAANAAAQTFTASAGLNPAITVGTPTVTNITKDGSGGISGTVTPGAGATETLVYIIDCGADSTLSQVGVGPTGSIKCGTQAAFNTLSNNGFTAMQAASYTVGPVTGTAAANWTLPNNVGPCKTPGCKGAAPTIPTGDDYEVIAISFDYPAFEAGPPGSTSATPTITGANGQADLAVSAAAQGTY